MKKNSNDTLTLNPEIKLIIGLGNPGKKYDKTPHNIGFSFLDNFIDQYENIKWVRKSKLKSKIINFSKDIILAKPITFMNLSGNSVLRLIKFYNLSIENILIIYDDINLPIGRIRFRRSGSYGGHNGIKSIIQYLGTNNFLRLKIGVGENSIYTIKDYVLKPFTKDKWQEVKKVLDFAKDGVNYMMKSGLHSAMTNFNN